MRTRTATPKHPSSKRSSPFARPERLEPRALLAAAFHGLGPIPGVAAPAYALDVSNTGVVVGLSFPTSGGAAEVGFRWSPDGGMENFGPGRAAGVSDDGSVVAGWAPSAALSGQPAAYRWTAAAGRSFLDPLPGTAEPGGARRGYANGISGDGAVVVGRSTSADGEQAVAWPASGGAIPLGHLPGTTPGSAANAASRDGSVVVGVSGDLQPTAFRWTAAGGIQSLASESVGAVSSAWAVSDDGSVVVGQAAVPGGQEPFVWRQSTGMALLGDFPGGPRLGRAVAVSGDGSVVLGYSANATRLEPFLWDAAHGMRKLGDVLTNDYGLGDAIAGWDLGTATALSSDGRHIVGAGINPAGRNDSWIVSLGAPPPPAPAVVARHVFYNDSIFDNRDESPNAADDAAIAPDKQPVLPGQLTSFSNITSYSKGINGVMFDVSGNLPLTLLAGIANTVGLKMGAGGDPAAWSDAPRPSLIGVRPGAGVDGSDRVTLTWPDGAIKNTWLRVSLSAPPQYIFPPDTFTFGNLVGEVGEPALTPTNWTVNSRDALLTRADSSRRPAPITSATDHNRDGVVDVLDYSSARRSAGQTLARVTGPVVAAAVPPNSRRAAARPPRRSILGDAGNTSAPLSPIVGD